MRGGLSNFESVTTGLVRSRSSWGGSSSTFGEGSGRYATSMSSGAPCGACKFLRRKCVRGCIFAPYFGAEQGAARFAAVHKIFGASNVAKLLLHIPVPRRCDAVLTISYEAQARLSDPVYGCVATIFALQQQVHSSKLTSGAGDGASSTRQQTSGGTPNSPAPTATSPAPSSLATTRADRHHFSWTCSTLVGVYAATRTRPDVALRHLHVDAERVGISWPGFL